MFKESDFSQLEKNSVKAQNQLQETDFVRFENQSGQGLRVMFVGNSITLHGYKPEIGWNGFWGMAASSKENDYVHLLMQDISSVHTDASFCICQVAEWERNYKNGVSKHHLFENAAKFEADIIVLRFIENCPHKDFDNNVFYNELDKLVGFLNSSRKAKVVITTGFWCHPGDEVLTKYAKTNNMPLVLLGDLGEDDNMKAIGMFEHKGVANHPGDLGMKAIAERIFECVKEIL